MFKINPKYVIKLDKKKYADKVQACWIGKNIGGTMGTPFEGLRQINDIQGFTTAPGVVLPNDDLDLQLVWLYALEQCGPAAINANLLGEHWISYITPHWNEYGLGKCNLKHLGNIDLNRIAHRELSPGNAHPVTTNRNSFTGGCLVYAVTHIALAQGSVTAETGPAVLVLKEKFNRTAKERPVAVLMHTDGQIAGNIDGIRTLKNEIGEVVGQVTVMSIDTRNLVVMGVNEKQVCDEELGLFIVKDARLHIVFVVGKQNGVQLEARTVTGKDTGGTVEEGNPLTSLVEGLGSAETNVFTYCLHLLEAL